MARSQRPELYVVQPEPDPEKPPQFGWLDVLAFTIAAYQLLLPVVGALIGVGLLVYGALWLLAR
ncbi:MAG TPA: hypothetical protein VF282_01825 [Bacillota bacterium]